METFLSVLAQIGIIALIVLLVVVIIILLLVFVDFSYNISGDFNIKDESKKYKAKAVIHSFLYMIYVAVQYDDTRALAYQVRVFGIPVIDSRREKKPKKKKAVKAKKDNNSKETVRDNKAAFSANKDAAPEETPKESVFNTFIERVKKVLSAIKKFFTFITDEKNKEAFKLIRVQIFKLIGKIRPKKIKGSLTFGMESPDMTGKILGISYTVMGILGTGINLNPDFDNKCLIGFVKVKGSFKVFSLIVIAVKILSNKTIRGYISTVSKLAAKAGK